MKEEIVGLIQKRLEQESARLEKEFLASAELGVARHCVIDNLLPKELAHLVFSKFPSKEQMRLLNSFREKKLTYKQLDNTSSLLTDITFAIQDPRIVALVEKITHIDKQQPDPSLYAGGLSMMLKGHFLQPHIDNSHDGERKYYRTVNLLYYVTPEWREEYGGNLELWDIHVKKPVTIASLFNRFVIMQTNRTSWHSVSPVRYDGQRCCVSNYYFSEQSPEGEDFFHVTSFSARPEQKIARLLAKADNLARMSVRKIIKTGIGKKDLYMGSSPTKKHFE